MAAAAFICSRATMAAALIPRRALSRRFSMSCSAASAASSSGQGAGGVEFTGKVGFLGLGIMGTPMASNLIKAGYQPSPAEVASSCDVTFAMLADPESAVEVACGTNGAAEGLAPGKGYVDVSTVDGATSKLIGERITSTGASFLESRFYLGDVGNGAAMKLVVNMVMGSMMVSFSEGLLLSEKAGLDPSTLVEGPSMVKATYPTAFPLKHQQKDLRLALTLAESVSQSIPTVAAANEVYKVAKSLGLADEDFSAVIEALKSKAQGSKQ
ncbi:hypothetical protein PR202_ga10722 [Eleusine coracana subsp. coracana]|uniref:Uncharacterized protein n=1 Tax=Eleusine coracana subsp. coracana TaxID=191504 RepID=A0AAV5C7D7_ELECO|nr:hypothetical protein PR202_ga10722 [Eleusine coracana subsp. coracana]